MWNSKSWVRPVCDTCEGQGMVHSYRRATVDDPYPESPCPDCDGPSEPECEVCGYDLEVDGFDCLACETAASLGPKALTAFDADAFVAALRVAIGKARQEKGV